MTIKVPQISAKDLQKKTQSPKMPQIPNRDLSYNQRELQRE